MEFGFTRADEFRETVYKYGKTRYTPVRGADLKAEFSFEVWKKLGRWALGAAVPGAVRRVGRGRRNLLPGG